MLKNNFLAGNTIYTSISHEDKILEKYFSHFDIVLKKIKRCENGANINDFLLSSEAKKDFKRLN